MLCVIIRLKNQVFDYDASKGISHMLVHKVFRRYTVRAKAGGGQSSHDNKVYFLLYFGPDAIKYW